MGKLERSLVRSALDYFYSFFESHAELVFFHDYNFISQAVHASKEIAKAEKLEEKEYELGLTAFILYELKSMGTVNKLASNKFSINEVVDVGDLPHKDATRMEHYAAFFDEGRNPRSHIEEALADGKEAYLSLPNALERLDRLRSQYEKVNSRTYSDLEWAEFCQNSFIMHPFYTGYANEKFGPGRSKNYDMLEKRLERLRLEIVKDST
jgi:alpha-ketoglutarate-dependent taurine dioxygenase